MNLYHQTQSWFICGEMNAFDDEAYHFTFSTRSPPINLPEVNYYYSAIDDGNANEYIKQRAPSLVMCSFGELCAQHLFSVRFDLISCTFNRLIETK